MAQHEGSAGSRQTEGGIVKGGRRTGLIIIDHAKDVPFDICSCGVRQEQTD